VRSARDTLAVAACLCLLAAGAAGCSSTQEKAAAQQARAAHILKARATRQATKRQHNHHKVDGPKTQDSLEKSAHQRGGSR
jgi:Flp pilus assembly protein TadB